MRSYNAERRLKKGIRAILAFNRFIECGKIGTKKRQLLQQFEQVTVNPIPEKEMKVKPTSIYC
jgi:hypothetical protein